MDFWGWGKGCSYLEKKKQDICVLGCGWSYIQVRKSELLLAPSLFAHASTFSWILLRQLVFPTKNTQKQRGVKGRRALSSFLFFVFLVYSNIDTSVRIFFVLSLVACFAIACVVFAPLRFSFCFLFFSVTLP